MILQLRFKMARLLMPAVWTFPGMQMMMVPLPRSWRIFGQVSHLGGLAREMPVDLWNSSTIVVDS